MKRLLLSILVAISTIMMACTTTQASHIFGGGLTYAWVSDSTYKITLTLYADCGNPATAGITTFQPAVCVYDSTNSVAATTLTLDSAASGGELLNTCVPPLTSYCQDMNSRIPGVLRYVFSTNYTLPYRSSGWRFVHGGATATAFGAIVAYNSLTNVISIGNLAVYYEAQLKVAQNSSPLILGGEQPYYCVNNPSTYAISVADPDGDSLDFALTPIYGNSLAYPSVDSCARFPVMATYVSPYTPSAPMAASGFSYNSHTGQITFTPSIEQLSMIAYTVTEYREEHG